MLHFLRKAALCSKASASFYTHTSGEGSNFPAFSPKLVNFLLFLSSLSPLPFHQSHISEYEVVFQYKFDLDFSDD